MQVAAGGCPFALGYHLCKRGIYGYLQFACRCAVLVPHKGDVVAEVFVGCRRDEGGGGCGVFHRCGEGFHVAHRFKTAGNAAFHAPIIHFRWRKGGEVEPFDGRGVATVRHYGLPEAVVGGDLQGVAAVFHCAPRKFAIPFHFGAFNGRLKCHFWRCLGGDIGYRGGKFFSESGIDAHCIPVVAGGCVGEGVARLVGDAEEVLVADSVAVGRLCLLKGERCGYGIHGVFEQLAVVGAVPGEGVATLHEVGGRAVFFGRAPCDFGGEGGAFKFVALEPCAEARFQRSRDKRLAEEHAAGGVVLCVLAREFHLRAIFFPVALGVAAAQCRDAVAGVVVAVEVCRGFAPPLGEGSEGGCGVGGSPVDLRRDVVERTVVHPCNRVAVDVAILPVACAYRRRIDAGCAGAVLGYACGRDAEACLGAGGFHGVIHCLNHLVHIGTTPVADGHGGAAVFVELVVGCRRGFCHAVGVEVVVKHDAIHFVVGAYLFGYIHYVVYYALQAGIEAGERTFGYEHPGVAKFHVVAGAPVVGGGGGPAVGVEPRVQLDAALVRFFYGIFKRVPPGVGAAAPRQIRRPRNVRRFVKGVAHGAHLEECYVESIVFERFEQFHQGGFLLGLRIGACAVDGVARVVFGPVESPRCRYPRPSKFPFWGGGVHYREYCEQCHRDNCDFFVHVVFMVRRSVFLLNWWRAPLDSPQFRLQN